MTNELILETKLNCPKCFHPYYARPRLHKRLDQGTLFPITLITAGAGYGKSALMSQWLESNPCKSVWLSCEGDIDQLEVLIRYLVFGISHTSKLEFTNTKSLLASSNEIPESTFRNSFISELNQLNEQLLLVLDDFHLLTNASTIGLIDQLLKHPVYGLHIYILTRKEPQLNIQHHLLKQKLQKIDANDLLFTACEIEEFASVSFNTKLSAESIRGINSITEGWVMGLMQNILAYYTQDLKSETGNQRTNAFHHFFSEEIINHQTELIQRSLVICALFNRFSSPLLHHILHECHQYNAIPADIVSAFEKNNFFIISLDNKQEWYRFHHQFKHTLALHGKQMLPPKLLCMYLKSGSRWLAANGFYEEALTKAVETNDPKFTIDLLEEFKYLLLNKDSYSRLNHLFHLLPLNWREKYPELLMTKVIILQYEGKINAIQAILSSCEWFQTNKDLSDQILAEYFTYKGMLCVYKGQNEEALKWLNEGISLSKPEAESLRTYAVYFKSQALSAHISIEEGLTFLTACLDGLPPKQHHSRARVLIAKVVLHKNSNDFCEMERHLPEIIYLCETNSNYEVLGLAYCFQVEILYRQNRFHELEEYFEKSDHFRYQMRATWYIYICYFKALYHLKTNNNELLRQTVHSIEDYANELKNEEVNLLLKFIKLELVLQKGVDTELEQLLNKNSYKELPSLRVNRYYYPRITYLKLLLQTDTFDKEAYTTLHDELLAYAHKSKNRNLIIQLHLLNCLELHQQGYFEKAILQLKSIVNHSATNQDLLVFTEYGQVIQEMVSAIYAEDKNNQQAHNILAVFNSISVRIAPHQPIAKKSITLKERDRRILELVTQGLKNDEIAKTMCLSPDSIKKYLYHVYQELGVNNRIKAARKAEELGLLEKVN